MSFDSFNVEYLTKQEIIYKELYDGILAKRYRPGERLDIEEIASRAGTSRTPVREAVRRLESQGLVTTVPHRGFFVSKFSLIKMLELYRIRAVLEGLAARLAAGQLTGGEVRRIQELVERMESLVELGAADKFLELNRPFHQIIYKAARSPLLYDYINDLYINTSRFRELAATVPGRLGELLDEHRSLAEAVVTGDMDEAERVARVHHENNAAAMLRIADQLGSSS